MPRDVKWYQIADEVNNSLPVKLPKQVTRTIVKIMLSNIFRVVRKRKSRITLRNADIHTIYIEPH